MKSLKYLIILFFVTFLPSKAAKISNSQVVSVNNNYVLSNNSDSINLTIYGWRGCVANEIRKVHLKSGINTVIFANLPQKIIPDTVVLFNQKDLSLMPVIQQTFVDKLDSLDLSIQKLFNLSKSIENQDVSIVYPSKDGVTVSGKYLTDDFIETSNGIVLPYQNYYLNFPNLKINAYKSKASELNPFLQFKVMIENEDDYCLNLFYMCDAINWNYTHSLILGSDDKCNFVTKAQVINDTSKNLTNVNLSLVAGKLSQITDLQTSSTKHGQGVNIPTTKVNNINSYAKYNIPYKCNILKDQDNYISLIQKNDLKYHKFLESENTIWYSSVGQEEIYPQVKIKIENNKKNNLGIIIPAGKVTAFEKNTDSSILYLGRSYIGQVMPSQDLNINMGQVNDVKILKKILSNDKVSRDKKYVNVIKCSYEISNYSDSNKDLNLSIKTANRSKLLSSSLKFDQLDDKNYVYHINLKSRNTQNLNIDLELYPGEY